MIITLLSDFGYQDNYIAVAKGILLRQMPQATIIDISHNVSPYHLLECSYLLKSSYSNFPKHTIHLSLFNILHHTPAELLIAQKDDQFIISADNGLLPLTFEDTSGQIHKSTATASTYLEWLQYAALMIKELASQDYKFRHLPIHQPLKHGTHVEALQKENEIECQVIHIDYYGNVIVNMLKDQFEKMRNDRSFRIRIVRETLSQISNDYSDVSPGRAVCLFNSAGYLEIAVNQGNASSLLGLRLHQETMIYYQHIKIEFL
jgi:S-adenosyl-L-methionine hydrolase (adenosine-forming)